VFCVFLSFSAVYLLAYKLTLSDHPRVTLLIMVGISELVYVFLAGPPLLGGGGEPEELFRRGPNRLPRAPGKSA